MLDQAYHIPAVWIIIALMILALVLDRFKTSLVFLAAVSALVMSGILPVMEVVGGLANRSILIIFLLILITTGLNDTFDLAQLFSRLFRKVKGPRAFIFRMGIGVAGFSALVNNTPVVAVMMPHVYDWGRKHEVSPSKLLMPLSFAAIAGGVITLIGTSTNLILTGLMEEHGLVPLTFSSFLWPGLAVTAVTITLLIFLAPLLLSDHQDLHSQVEENKREYLVETTLLPEAPLVGKSIEEAGLRNLKGIFLTEIIRAGKSLKAVGPQQILEADDILLFAGETERIFDLVNREEGLSISKTDKFNLVQNVDTVEAVVAQNSSLDRQNVKQLGFREKFDAAIIGIHRRGEKLSGKIGSIELRTGDLLLLVAGPEFKDRNHRSEDMIVLSSQELPSYFSWLRKGPFLLITLGLILASVFSLITFFEALMGIALTQVFLGMLKVENAKKAVSLDLLIILISALSLGNALIHSGASDALAEGLLQNIGNWSPFWVLAAVFGATFLLTSFVTNVAAISIMFPVVFSLSAMGTVSTEGLFLTAAYGASCCFITPYAYQTNLMVMELGKYRFKDFFKLGFFVSLFYAATFLSYAAIRFI